MAEIYKGVWEDDQGNKLYSDNDTETTRDMSGIPLNNGGDLSEASVNFTVGTSRKALTPKARFKALMGDIAKWLTDLGPAAFYKVADDFTTTAENYLFTARKGKQLKDEIDGINSDLDGCSFDVKEDGAYIIYTPPGGADPVSKKLGNDLKIQTKSATFPMPGVNGEITVDFSVVFDGISGYKLAYAGIQQLNAFNTNGTIQYIEFTNQRISGNTVTWSVHTKRGTGSDIKTCVIQGIFVSI